MYLTMLLQYSGTIHLRNTEQTILTSQHCLLSYKYLAVLILPIKDSSCFELKFCYSKSVSHCYL